MFLNHEAFCISGFKLIDNVVQMHFHVSFLNLLLSKNVKRSLGKPATATNCINSLADGFPAFLEISPMDEVKLNTNSS
jgi:hypothetical protein